MPSFNTKLLIYLKVWCHGGYIAFKLKFECLVCCNFWKWGLSSSKKFLTLFWKPCIYWFAFKKRRKNGNGRVLIYKHTKKLLHVFSWTCIVYLILLLRWLSFCFRVSQWCCTWNKLKTCLPCPWNNGSQFWKPYTKSHTDMQMNNNHLGFQFRAWNSWVSKPEILKKANEVSTLQSKEQCQEFVALYWLVL